MRKYLFLLISMLPTVSLLPAQILHTAQQGKLSSIRGLSVVNDRISWISGSKGYVAISADGGDTWKWQQVKGFEQSDFRDIEAFSEKEAIIMSSGTPALILKTTNGGKTWKEVYRNDEPTYFLDAMTFFNPQHGIVLGDPIAGKFLLLETKNKGKTWIIPDNLPAALPGEAAFAASGTCVLAIKRKNILELITGGATARLLSSKKLKNWSAQTLPITQGQASKGAFSIAEGGGYRVITGGNYQENKDTNAVACYADLRSKGVELQLPKNQPFGYQSCVTYLNRATFLATGTSGTNITVDGGRNWKQIDTVSYNVCQKAKHGKLVILAGDKGRIAVFKK